MATPDFVVVGHVVRDLVPQGWRLGGTATYAAVQAQRLGQRVGVVTRVGPEVRLKQTLRDALVAGAPSSCTTSFENVYESGRRRQRVLARADDVSVQDIPRDWRSAGVVLLGPVCGEVPAGLAGMLSSAPLVGVSAQGWLRRVDRQERVRKRAWRGEPFWSGCDVLFVSDEDLGERRDQLERWCRDVPVVVLTRDRRGARVHMKQRWRSIDAFPAEEVDPTGAGDVFAAAFLVRYRETQDVAESMRLASAAAACSIEAPGVDGIADRETIDARVTRDPGVVLR